MNQPFLKFGDAEIEKIKFHSSKETIAIGNVNIKKLLVSDAFAYGIIKKTNAKFPIGYEDGRKIRPLIFRLSQMSGHANSFNKTKRMNFVIKNEGLPKTYKTIWITISNIIGQTFDRQHLCEQKYLRTKIKSYNGKIITDFYDKKCAKKALIVSAWQQ